MVNGLITLQCDGKIIGPFDAEFVLIPNELNGWTYRGRHNVSAPQSDFYFTGWRPKSKMIFKTKSPEDQAWLKAQLVLMEEYKIIQFQFYGKTETDPF